MPTSHTSAGPYEIRVQGRLEQRWASWFDGFTLTSDRDGTTVISGHVVDQAALHGLLQSLRDLGLPLLSVMPAPDDPSHSSVRHEPAATRAQHTHPVQEDLR